MPLIFATYIPAPEKATADLKRKISASEERRADLLLKTARGEKISADTLRGLVQSEKSIADTWRRATCSETISGDTFRNVIQSTEISADTFRELKKTERTIADTSRKMGLISATGDLRREIRFSTLANADTCIKNGFPENILADLRRIVASSETVEADSFRKVNATNTVSADTCRKAAGKEIISADTERFVGKSETARADTLLQITTSEKVAADLMRGIREIVRADTFRQVQRIEIARASTVIRVPHILNYTLLNRQRTLNKARLLQDNPASLVNTFKSYGVTAFDISLNEKTLSDNFNFDIFCPMEINDAVQGNLLDYPFNFLVEETNQTESIQNVKGQYNQDELLYTQFFLPTATYEGKSQSDSDNTEEVVRITASGHIKNIARHLNLSADIKIEDFTPYNLDGNHRITYSDLLASLFGWTSDLPQRQINVFIRGGVLHCIQRGKEDSVFDISDLPHSRPTVNKKLIRSLWSNPKGEDPNDDEDPTIDYLYDEAQEPFSGVLEFEDEGCSTKLVYSNGLLRHERNETENDKSTLSSAIDYSYIEIFPSDKSELEIFLHKLHGDFYLARKSLSSSVTKAEETENNDKTKVTYEITEQYGYTEYRYAKTEGDDVYLSSEIEEMHTKTWDNDKLTDTEFDVRETFHVPIGNGWYGQSVYHNGEAQGSNISQGKPGNKITQYMLDEVQKTFRGWKITRKKNNGDGSGSGSYDDWRRKLAPIVNTSFPVREFDLLGRLTEALRWLNRKIQKTVTLDLVDHIENGIPNCNHIVDFTERVKLDGEEYFLVSNRIFFTPHKLIQKLQLIRWY